MADIKDKETVDGFDFDGMDWGNDEGDTVSSSSSPKSTGGQDNPFEAAADDDDGFGGGDSFYSLEQMPDTDSHDAFTDLGGSDDFGDIKTDDGPVSYDFGSEAEDLPAGRKITDDHSQYEASDDPFGGAGGYDVAQDDDGDTVDPFALPDADPAEASAEEEVAGAEPKAKSKFMTYLMAAAAAVIAVAGIAYVVPSFIGSAPQEVAAVQPVQDDAPPFPASLPVQSVAQPEITAPEVAQVTPPVVPPIQPSSEAKPVDPPALTLPDLQPGAVDTAPVAVRPPVVAEAPSIPAKDDPFKDLVGGKERGGIDAMKDTAPSVTDAKSDAASGELAALARRLADLEGKVDRLADSFDNYVEMNVKSAPAVHEPASTTTASVDASGNFVPPMKPPIIEGVSLKGVAGDVAWLSSKAGVFEVKVGDPVPNGGDVTAFRQYRGDWIVVTTSGIIVRQ